MAYYLNRRVVVTGLGLLAVPFFLLGCNTAVVPTESIIGRYTVTYEQYRRSGVVLGTERLTLNDDGTYTQEFTSSTGTTWTHSGMWTVDPSVTGGATGIFLQNRMDVLDKSAAAGKLLSSPEFIDSWHGVEKIGRKVRILIDPDDDYYYQQTS